MFWNGTIRIYLEAYLDLTMPAMLNSSLMEWPEDSFTVTVSNIIAIILLILGTTLPIFFFFWAICTRKQWV